MLRGRHVQEELASARPNDRPLVGASPHIADYWQVISRRLWLVVLIFGVTTASAIWAASQQSTVYETNSSIQTCSAIGGALGAIAMIGLNLATGIVPGGMIGGALGGFVGALIGFGFGWLMLSDLD